MKPPTKTMKRTALAAAAIATVGALATTGTLDRLGIATRPALNSPPPEAARTVTDDYKRVAQWRVRYDDIHLGMVEGAAICRWVPISVRGKSGTLPGQCDVKVRDPRTGQLYTLTAQAADIKIPAKDNPTLRIVLHGKLPGDQIPPPAKPALSISGGPGETATISIKNGRTQAEGKVEISATATPDSDQVTVELTADDDGNFVGEWRYAADPLTEREADGGGGAGNFDTLRDEDVAGFAPGRTGGFLGVQRGRMVWRPLPPEIYAVHVVEDQSEFSGRHAAYRYPFPTQDSQPENPEEIRTRTLVVIGRHLPMLEDDPVFEIDSKETAVQYRIVAHRYASNVKPADTVVLERAWRDVTANLYPAEVPDFRKLDAVIVRVQLGNALAAVALPGPKSFTWGTASSTWTLQYGDNNADVRFVRLVRQSGPSSGTLAGGPGPQAAAGGDEYEVVDTVALPEKVFVEVNTGIKLLDSTIPVIVGGPGITTVSLPATRIVGHDTTYRTPPVVFAPPAGDVESAGATLVRVPLDGHVLATADRGKTLFLRAGVASAVPRLTHPAGLGLFTDTLKRAAGCEGRDFDRGKWPTFARQTAETIRGVKVTFGDHAAMILLRDRFIAEMRAQIDALPVTAVDPVGADPSDHLVDAWYRNVEPAVRDVRNFRESPLATFKVSSLRGPVPFANAYSYAFKETVFEPEATTDGEARYLTWRRQASREAIRFVLQTMREATAKAQSIQTCDRAELLKLTGVGFGHVAARVAPLLMKMKGPGEEGYRLGNLSEPDFVARGYASNLDNLADAVQAQKELSSARYAVIMSAASLVLILAPPLAGLALGTALGDAAASAAGAVSTYVAGFPLFTYESASQYYSTYQEHEDVRFALGAYAVLGIDRYFDAAERATPWWQTGLSIFGNAVLQGAPMAGEAHPTPSKGLSIWRAERIVAGMESTELPAIRALPAATRRDVATLLLQARAELETLRLHSEENLYLTRTWNSLDRETRRLPRIPEEPVAQALGRQALVPTEEFGPTGTVVGKPDPFRIAKAETAEAELLSDAKDGADVPLAKGETLAVAPKTGTVIDVRIRKPTVVPQSSPREPVGIPIPNNPDRTWTATIKVGGADITIRPDVGDLISDKSAFFLVYKLRSAEGLPQGILDELAHAGVGIPGERNVVVMKVFHRSRTLTNFGRDFPGIDENVVDRMLKAQGRLKDTPVRYEKIAGFTGTSDIEFQRFLEQEPGKLVLLNGRDVTEGQLKKVKGGGRDMALAILKETEGLIDQDLVMLDNNLGNYVLKHEGGAWVSSILDMDMVGTVEDVSSGPYANFFKGTVLRKDTLYWRFKAASSRPMSNARAIMYDRMVMRHWLIWNEAAQRLESGIMRVEEVRKIFPDMPFLPPKRSQARPLDFAALQDIINNGGGQRRALIFGRPALAPA